MQQNIAWRHQWPVLLFHTGEFDIAESRNRFFEDMKTHEWSRDAYLLLRARIEFVKVKFTFPPGVSSDVNMYKPKEFEYRWPGECRTYSDRFFLIYILITYTTILPLCLPLKVTTTCVGSTPPKSSSTLVSPT